MSFRYLDLKRTYPFQISVDLIIPNFFFSVTVDSKGKQTTLIILFCLWLPC